MEWPFSDTIVRKSIPTIAYCICHLSNDPTLPMVECNNGRGWFLTRSVSSLSDTEATASYSHKLQCIKCKKFINTIEKSFKKWIICINITFSRHTFKKLHLSLFKIWFFVLTANFIIALIIIIIIYSGKCYFTRRMMIFSIAKMSSKGQ